MGSHPVKIVRIDSVTEHPNGDFLELSHVGGWQIVTQKDTYEAGHTAIFIPIDSLLTTTLEEYLFPPDAKIKLSNHRIRSIKIRQALSQGMLINPRDDGLLALFPALSKIKVGDDVTEVLGVTKYEPPEPSYQQFGNTRREGKRTLKNNPLFSKYTDIENWKHYTELFNSEEEVYITEKVHGTSARYGLYERNPRRLLGWVQKFLMKTWLDEENRILLW